MSEKIETASTSENSGLPQSNQVWQNQAAAIWSNFESIDDDKDGTLSRAELNSYSVDARNSGSEAAAVFKDHVDELSTMAVYDLELPSYRSAGADFDGFITDSYKDHAGISKMDLEVMQTVANPDTKQARLEEFRHKELRNARTDIGAFAIESGIAAVGGFLGWTGIGGVVATASGILAVHDASQATQRIFFSQQPKLQEMYEGREQMLKSIRVRSIPI